MSASLPNAIVDRIRVDVKERDTSISRYFLRILEGYYQQKDAAIAVGAATTAK